MAVAAADSCVWRCAGVPGTGLPDGCRLLMGLIVARDVLAFHHAFVEGHVYDPVTWNLPRVQDMMPTSHPEFEP